MEVSTSIFFVLIKGNYTGFFEDKNKNFLKKTKLSVLDFSNTTKFFFHDLKISLLDLSSESSIVIFGSRPVKKRSIWI